MTKKPVGVRWFVEPLNDSANEIVTRYLTDIGRPADDDVKASLRDERGKSHPVWEVPSFQDITRFLRNRNTDPAEFHFYSMPVGDSVIYLMPHADPRKGGRRSAAARKIRAAIEATRR
jgi:hypothetical protein